MPVTDWARMQDSRGRVDRVPALLERVRRDDADVEAWKELSYRLCLEHDLLFPASFAALPDLVRLAPGSAAARALAGVVVRRAAGHHGCDELWAACAPVVAELRDILDRHLRTRPDDYVRDFVSLLATAGLYHWSAVLQDFTDDFFPITCPHCATAVTTAIGDYGRYSAIRDWHRGDIDRHDLRPASAADLTGVGRWMYETAIRDGQEGLALGIAHLFGKAKCPRCGSLFELAAEYAAANGPFLTE